MEKNTDNRLNSQASEEVISISILDLINLVRNFWKIILVSCLTGLCLGVGYAAVIPPQFEVSGLIRIAQLQSTQQGSPQFHNLEEPAILIYKLKNPNFFKDKGFEVCGAEGHNKLGDQLISRIKLTPLAGNNSVMKLSVLGASLTQCLACADLIFEEIKKNQDITLIKEHTEANRRLTYYQTRLDDLKDFLKNPPKGDISQSISYLVSRDEAQFALREIEALKQFIRSIEAGSSMLLSPFYGSDTQVFPNKKLILIIATLMGLVFGCIFAYLQRKGVINLPTFLL